MRVKCLAQEHNAMPQPGLKLGPLDLESSTPTIFKRHGPSESLLINIDLVNLSNGQFYF